MGNVTYISGSSHREILGLFRTDEEYLSLLPPVPEQGRMSYATLFVAGTVNGRDYYTHMSIEEAYSIAH